MIINESEFVAVFAIFLLGTVILKNIEFLLRRSGSYLISYNEARKIRTRLDELETWMGMDEED